VDPQAANVSFAPALDEATFQQILQAAYIIQEQNDAAGPRRPKLDPATTLAVIAETQETLRALGGDLRAASKLIVERLATITHATGIAAAVIQGEHIEYCAAIGTSSGLAGSSGPIGKSISELLRDEKSINSAAGNSHQNSPAFFPVYAEGRIVGLLQLDFPESESIQEHEIQSCQVMSGLMAETISRAAELEWKQTLAQERATMLQALEQLKPQLERLTADSPTPSGQTSAPQLKTPAKQLEIPSEPLPDITDLLAQLTEAPEQAPASEAEVQPEAKRSAVGPKAEESAMRPALPQDSAAASRMSSSCLQCGFQFGESEMFCGRCGTPRSISLSSPVSESPSESHLDEPLLTHTPVVLSNADVASVHDPVVSLPEQATLHLGPADAARTDGTAALAMDRESEAEPQAEEQQSQNNLELVPQPAKVEPSPFASAYGARKWLESLKKKNSPGRLWMDKHQGDLSLIAAVLVLVIAFFGWTPHPSKGKAHAKASSQPSLTLFERALVGLGLAEAPPATPVYLGNPNVQVWEDVHTALYYCSGADLYGKTPGGKVTTQRDAQLDQFEPAARRACD
jgi:hypothetical protein